MEFRLLNQEIDSLRSSLHERAGTLEQPQAFASIITTDREMYGLFRYLECIADSRANLLIEGETGTGKELFARAVHDLSGRTGPFVAVNVAGLDDTAFSDTLFGHVRGAYTGADDKRAGMLAAARAGTLLLDEVGDLGMTAQVKLLRLLQSGEYYPLGSDVVQHADVRIIAATNELLADKCRAGTFRKDLYYRLCTHRVSIPPLRERRADLERLVPHFVAQAAADTGCSPPNIPPETYLLLANYPFPGNVRELQAMIIDAVSCSTGPVLSLRSLQKHVGASVEHAGGDAECPESLSDASVLPTINQMKQRLIEEALRRTAGNQSQAAALIGVTQQTISRHLRKES
jgi:transcriptional regulator with PAS, ATPase and Fis domain